VILNGIWFDRNGGFGLPATGEKAFAPRGVYSPTITAFETDESLSLEGTRAFVRFLLGEEYTALFPWEVPVSH
jgi:hypothetical protein